MRACCVPAAWLRPMVLVASCFLAGAAPILGEMEPTSFTPSGLHASNRPIASILDRIDDYCNNPPAEALDEGVPPAPGAVLLQAHVAFRHGDRSAIHGLPGTIPFTSDAGFKWPCSAPSKHEVSWASAVLQPVLSSPECVVSPNAPHCGFHVGVNVSTGGGQQASVPPRIQTAMRAWARARVEGDGCGPEGGDLSSVGWQQLQALGTSLAQRYSALLLRDDANTSAVAVISTDTGRTVLSATAFFRGLLHGVHVAPAAGGDALAASSQLAGSDDTGSGGGSGGSSTSVSGAELAPVPQAHRQQMSKYADFPPASSLVPPSKLTDTEGESVGHPLVPQLSLPLPLHVTAREDDPMMFARGPKACPRALAYEVAHRDAIWAHISLPGDIAQRVAALAGLLHVDEVAAVHGPHPPSTLLDATLLVPNIEQTADDLYTRVCHGHALPCWATPTPPPPHSNAALDAPLADSGDCTAPLGDAAAADSRSRLEGTDATQDTATAGTGTAGRNSGGVLERGQSRRAARQAAETSAAAASRASGVTAAAATASPAPLVAPVHTNVNFDADELPPPLTPPSVAALVHPSGAVVGDAGASVPAITSQLHLHLHVPNLTSVAAATLPTRHQALLQNDFIPDGVIPDASGVAVPASQCLSSYDASRLLDQADEHYLTRYGGVSTRWLMYPFFNQVRFQLLAAQSAGAATSPPPRFVVRAAHDTVISPTLSVLGLRDRISGWPGYASRIGFELWRTPIKFSSASTGTAVAPGGNGDGSTTTTREPRGATSTAGAGTGDADTPSISAGYVVKVLFNGKDITARTQCGAGGACTLARFSQFVDSLIPPALSWKEFCES